MGIDLTDYQKDDSFGLLEKGDYEVILEKIEIKKALSGNNYANFTYRVRSDVDQKFKNRIIFDTIFQEKDASGKSNGFFNRARITKIVKAVYPENTPLKFDSIEDIFESIVGKKLVVNVNQRHDDFRDDEVNYVVYFKASQHGDKVLTSSSDVKNPISESSQGENVGIPASKQDDPFISSGTSLVTEDDLPF